VSFTSVGNYRTEDKQKHRQ